MRLGLGVIGVAIVGIACGESGATKTPEHVASTSPTAWPSADIVDASLDFAPAPKGDAGPRSDCVPLVNNDGSADTADPDSASEKLTTCLRYTAMMPQAHEGRICYELNFTTGIFTRVPAASPRRPHDGVAAALAEHASAAAEGYVVKASSKDVTICKGAACQTLKPDGFKPPAPSSGESCLTSAVRQAIPADVSPDGATLFVVRHESCALGMNAWGETYDLKTRRRIARASLQLNGVVTNVAWIGKRILIRDCNEDGTVCGISPVDPKAPPPPARAASVAWNGKTIDGINPGGLERYLARAKGDLWAVVDRAGGTVAFLNGDDAKVDHALKLPIAPEVPRPLIVGLRPPQQLYLFYAGTGRVILVDLASGQVAASLTPPFCGDGMP